MKKLFTILGIAVVAGIMLTAAGTANAGDWNVNVRFDSGHRSSHHRHSHHGSYYPSHYYSAPVVTYSYGYGSGRVIYVSPQPAVVYSTPVYYSQPAPVYYSYPTPSYYQCPPSHRPSSFYGRYYGR